MDNYVVMPFDYEDDNIDIHAFKKEKAVKKVFEEYYTPKEEQARKEYKFLTNTMRTKIFTARLEEYYGEAMELIENLPVGSLDEILKSENKLDKIYELTELPQIDFNTGNKETLTKN